MTADTPRTPPDAAGAERPGPCTSQAVTYRVQLLPGGEDFAASESVPLLLAAQQAGITMASSCRNGTCRACLCQLISGAVTYNIAWPGVSAEEKRDGLILPCVACAGSDVILAPLGAPCI